MSIGRRLREICNRYNILLIADEVMSGFGRVGEWFAWQKYGLENAPDMMTLAKGITGAHVPLGAVVVNQRVADYFDDHLLESGLTYSGHPLACAAGVAAIDAYESENLIQRSRELGAWLMTAPARDASSGCPSSAMCAGRACSRLSNWRSLRGRRRCRS